MNPRQCGCICKWTPTKNAVFHAISPLLSLSSSVDESESLIHRKNKNLELLIFFVFLLLSWLSSIAKAVVEILNVCYTSPYSVNSRGVKMAQFSHCVPNGHVAEKKTNR